MLKTLARPIYYSLYRLRMRASCYLADRLEYAAGLPPALLRFRVSETHSAKSFTDIGQACGRILESCLRDAGFAWQKGSRVLDFGCGCGRTIIWLIRDHPDVIFCGCDVDTEAVAWCQQHLTGDFQINQALPPLPYDAAYFDVIYCVSVFTHLNEAMQDAWLEELRRIVKPNGLIVLTVHGSNAAAILTPAERLALESTGILHKTSRKLKGLVPDWYHTTWHSRAYITAKLARRFRSVSYREIPDGLQDFVVASGTVAVPDEPAMRN